MNANLPRIKTLEQARREPPPGLSRECWAEERRPVAGGRELTAVWPEGSPARLPVVQVAELLELAPGSPGRAFAPRPWRGVAVKMPEERCLLLPPGHRRQLRQSRSRNANPESCSTPR